MIATIRLLSGEHDDFVLDMQMDTEETLDQLHQAIQQALQFDAAQMASFFTTDQEWNKETEIALFDLGAETPMLTMEQAILVDFIREPHQRFLYVFDFFSERCLFMEVIGLAEGALDSPLCVQAKGTPPSQILMEQESDNFYSDPEEDLYAMEHDFVDLDSLEDWNTDLKIENFDDEYGY